MRLEKWFISNLDDSQRKIITQNIEDSLIVKGAAGSGKTNLAIHRARLAQGKGTYAIVIFTIALKRMVSYGMKALGLDHERIAYDWAWNHRGFDLTGDVYCELTNSAIDRDVLYLVNDNKVRKFKRTKEKSSTSYGIDFGDWVEGRFYCAFGRRTSWFDEVSEVGNFDVTNEERFVLIPSGTMYKQAESTIDYLIIDEAQDFNVSKYKENFLPKVGKSLSLFGDSAQQMNSQGSNIESIASALGYDTMSLNYNYRLPKSIAKVAQKISGANIDLMSNNRKDGGNSDYPNYPKPVVTEFSSEDQELEDIVNKIKMEDLDDVAILVPDEATVRRVNDYLNNHEIQTQVHYRTGQVPPFRTINTLDFSNNDLPCVLTYYAAKGSEFDNVFVPFANSANTASRNAFYVACTRASRQLFISYSGKKTSYLNDVNPNDIEMVDMTKQNQEATDW